MAISFKKDTNKLKNDFQFEMYDLINQKYEKNQVFFDIVDHYLNHKNVQNFIKLKRILTIAFKNETEAEKIYNFVEENLSDNQGIHEDNQNEKQILQIVKEFQQIQQQSDEMLGKSISIAKDINIVKTNEDNQHSQVDNIDLVEMIDIGGDMDGEIVENDNIVCIFCNKNNIIIISDHEGFCYDCDKRFLIRKKG